MAEKAFLCAMRFRPDFSNRRGPIGRAAFERQNREAAAWPRDAPISDYPELRAALNSRRVELGMTMLDVDARAGLSDGFSARLLSKPKSARAVYKRNLGPVSLPLVLGALKVRLRLEPVGE